MRRLPGGKVPEHTAAEEFAEKDKSRKAAIDAKNEADTAIYSSERSVNEYRDKVPAEVISAIEAELAALRAAVDGGEEDAEVIREKINALQKATMKIGEHMQQQAPQGEGAQEGGAAEGDAQPGESDQKKEEGK